jgi:hypothetical protein
MANLQEALEWIHRHFVAAIDTFHHMKELAHSALRAVRHWRNHILKAIGILLSISFAGASLYYAKVAADDARCQRRLVERKYCETQPEYIARQSPCKEVLHRGMQSHTLCYAPRGY